VTRLRCLLGEAAQEFRFGLTTGIPLLIFAGIAAYMLIVMSSAGYMRDMAAVDIPRNAPSIVYMMTSGCAFFLFFAWAWIFAQPVLRDRRALLHEVVLAAPVSLRALLLGRYVGALGVAALLGAAQAAGFLLAPSLELLGAVPAGAIGPTPWAAMAWGWLLFALPTAAGTGAMCLALTIVTRSLAGAFAGGAAMLLCWMVAMALMDASIDPSIATILDPSGYADVDRTVRFWTPSERSSALYPLSGPILLNRAFWCGLPLLALAGALMTVTRERLVLDAVSQPKRHRRATKLAARSVPMPAWLSEVRLQFHQALAGRALWIGAALVALIGLASMFVHVIGHADGPLIPTMELALPILQRVLFLVIAFIVAAIAGHVMRRDDRPGFDQVIAALPAPIWLLMAGRIAAVFSVVIVLSLAPAISAYLGGLTVPGSAGPATPLLFQAGVLMPALLELAAVAMFVHAAIRPSGPAYAVSILATFILVVNHETALVTHPLFEFAMPATLSLSQMLGWEVWYEKLLIIGGYKLAGAITLMGLAALMVTSGRAFTFHELGNRLRGPIGLTILGAFAALLTFGFLIHREAIERGGYRSQDEQVAEDAAWEKRWLSQAAAFSLDGGGLDLHLEPDTGIIRGVWRIRGFRSDNDTLQAELPEGFVFETATVDGRRINPLISQDHLALPLGNCAATGCAVNLYWRVEAKGWSPDGAPPRLSRSGLWLTAEQAVPRLGFDIDRLLRASPDRTLAGLPPSPGLPMRNARQSASGVAPAADWQWRIHLVGGNVAQGRSSGPLDPLFAWFPKATAVRVGQVDLRHGADRSSMAKDVAEDVRAMRRCVARRLGGTAPLNMVIQLPRSVGEAKLANGVLLLPESPYWDVAATGQGRLSRRAAIGRVIAGATIAEAAALRQGDGAQWLLQGVPGAIGLLCVGDVDGVASLASLLARESEKAALTMTGSRVPLGRVGDAQMRGWVGAYTPLASLSWAASQSPATLRSLVAQANVSKSVAQALARTNGPVEAAMLLGAPMATELAAGQPAKAKSWRWISGAWQPTPPPTSRVLLVNGPGGLHVRKSNEKTEPHGSFVLDARPFMERTPADNLSPAGPSP
jgi:hypothetical protein